MEFFRVFIFIYLLRDSFCRFAQSQFFGSVNYSYLFLSTLSSLIHIKLRKEEYLRLGI